MKSNKPNTKKTTVKTKTSSADAFTNTEVRVLIEEFRGEFRVFGEELSAVKGKVEAIFQEVGRQKENIFIIKADIRIIKKDIVELKQDVAVLKQDVAVLKQGSIETNSRLSNIEQTTKEVLKAHSERISHLELEVLK